MTWSRVDGLGPQHSGAYQVKAVTHVINAADHFMDLELRRNAIGGGVSMQEGASHGQHVEVMEGRFFGKYRGMVKNNVDPTGRGRLEVLVPAVMGEAPVWALPCVPYAGKDVGFFALPDEGTGVWVEFEAGDPSYPIWVGCFWADDEIATKDAAPTVKFIRTKKMTIRIDDTVGELVIENAAGSSFKLTPLEIIQKSQTITNQVGTKKTELTPVHFDVHNGAFTVV